jgi:RHS repeat-associated protein
VSIVVNTAPAASITSPAANTVFTAPANITVNATAADSDGTIAQVEFFDGATLVGTVTAAPYSVTINTAAGGSHILTARATDNRGTATTSAAVTIAPYSVALTNVALGAHSYTASATDNLGIVTTSAAINVLVNAPPSASITSPASGAPFTAPATIALTASAADADGTIAKVDFYQGTTLLGTSTSAPYGFAWTNVPGGSYSLTAVATDDRGGTSTSAAVAVTVNAPPSVSITAPANGALFAAPAEVTVTASATDPDGSLAKVEFFQDATLVGTVTTAPYTVTLSSLASGSYVLTAVATDAAGASTTSAAITIRANTAPTVSITSPTSGASFSAPANITLAADAADSDGTLASVAFYYGTTLIATRTAPPYSFTWTGVPQGSYVLTAVTTDELGASTTSAAVSVTVNQAVAQGYYIHVDHLNTPRLVADATGTTVWRWDQQEPFGVNVSDENPSGLGAFEFPLRFPGQYADKETNVFYNYFRDYDAGIGRYLESDPIGLRGGLNVYAYVRGSPVALKDPRGLDKQSGIPDDEVPPAPWPRRLGYPDADKNLIGTCFHYAGCLASKPPPPFGDLFERTTCFDILNCPPFIRIREIWCRSPVVTYPSGTPVR